MQKHTPGPWEWNDRGQLIAVSVAGSNDEDAPPFVIVETDGGFYGPRGADRDLLALAPELLAAIVDMAESYEHEGLPEMRPLIAARAVILKATGGVS